MVTISATKVHILIKVVVLFFIFIQQTIVHCLSNTDFLTYLQYAFCRQTV